MGLLFIVGFTKVFAQIPSGYYDTAEQLNGNDLKIALHNIIKDHQPQTYAQLWQAFSSTDKKPNEKVWDMYSDVPDGIPAYEYTFFTDQCGNYGGEGQCYNREHSWPKSWFNDQMPMYTDLFHIVPTDGYVNNKRGNYPYGEVSQASWTSTNGSKLGPSSTQGYSGVVFEPIDSYKGDFARGMMYMSVRYYGEDGNWSGSGMTNGAELLDWAKTLMLTWHLQDPVNQKEIDRNNAVYLIQLNRNPFVDRPEFAMSIWDPTASVETTLAVQPLLRLSPNPSNSTITVTFTEYSTTAQPNLYFTDITGKTLYISPFNKHQNSTQVDISMLQPGFYFVHLIEGNRIISTTKLIRN